MIWIWIDYRHTDMLKLELAVTWQWLSWHVNCKACQAVMVTCSHYRRCAVEFYHAQICHDDRCREWNLQFGCQLTDYQNNTLIFVRFGIPISLFLACSNCYHYCCVVENSVVVAGSSTSTYEGLELTAASVHDDTTSTTALAGSLVFNAAAAAELAPATVAIETTTPADDVES